jgi:peroxiredoxin
MDDGERAEGGTVSIGQPASPRAAWLLLGAGLLVGLAAGLVVFYGLPAWPAGGQPVSAVFPGGPTSTPAAAPVVGAPAPDFTLKDLSGHEVALSSYAGDVVLINFWATWCGPCLVEMPAIERRYEALKDRGLVVLAVDDDEAITDVSAFAHELDLTFTLLLDPGAAVNDLYRVRGLPTSFVVDREGVIRQLHIGLMTEEQLDGYLAKAGLGN